MTEIDDAIRKVEDLYRTVTGHDAPPLSGSLAPLPPHRDPVEHVQEQLNSLSRLLAGGGARQPQASALATPFTPPLGVWEQDGEFVFSLDVPGVSREDFEVNVRGGFLVVTGRRTPIGTAPDAAAGAPPRLRLIEQRLGAFHRAIPLPSGVRGEQVTATLRNGVLVLKIPRESGARATSRSVRVSHTP